MKTLSRPDLTFKFNKSLGRHGWLRLTPAYSVKVVKERLLNLPKSHIILDPFSGTATTPLVASELGYESYAFDINPFLIWLGRAKNYKFTPVEISSSREVLRNIIDNLELNNQYNWQPDIFNIERWWSTSTLKYLSALRSKLVMEIGEPSDKSSSSLIWIAFCRLVIETSSAAFNHISMSFKDDVKSFIDSELSNYFFQIAEEIINTAEPILSGSSNILICNSVNIEKNIPLINKVLTSPPYPNRISYIRELRPYMYWTKFIEIAKTASEIDWLAIGGTWGSATSKLNDWKPCIPEYSDQLESIISEISKADSKNGKVLSIYVKKYFYDMHMHLSSLRTVLAPGASLNYILGNSTFYGVSVDTSKLIMESLKLLGYSNIHSEIIRKRNSKKELFEYDISATFN